MTTVLDSPISYDAGFFIGQDTDLDFIVYADGTTQAQVDADTATKVDLSGATLVWKMALTRHNPTALLSYSTPTEITIDPDQAGAGKGHVTVHVKRDDTLLLAAAGFFWHGLANTAADAYDVIADGPCRVRRATV